MTRSMAVLRALAMAGLLGVSTAMAADTEAPPSFNPARLRAVPPTGVNYSILSPVRSDGFLRVYQLRTPFGDITVVGDHMVRMRIVELAAIDALDRVSTSESFQRGLADAGLAPLRFTGALLTNPAQAIGNTVAGVGNFFGQIGSGLSNMGKTQDEGLGSLIGVTRKRRELAVQLNVDPYTDFAPLAERLTKLSEAAAVGGLVVNGALMAIPGVGGAVVGYTYTGIGLHDTARDYSAAQLLDLNRPKLYAMGVDRGLAEAFLMNRAYTPLDATAIVARLESMQGVDNRAQFIERAAAINRRDAAFFMRVQAEMLAGYYARNGGLGPFAMFGEFPFNYTRNGVVGLWPVDAISWTPKVAATMHATAAAIKRSGRGATEVRITGQTTALAKQNFKALGWNVVENARP